MKNAFLNSDLEDKIYIEIPSGFEMFNNSNKVYRLRKSLYGLKQSLKAWFESFTRAVKEHGYIQRHAGHILFTRQSKEGKIAILIVYVDDIIITRDYLKEMSILKKVLTKEFEAKDLDNLKYFLGMEVAQSKKGIFVFQCKHVLDLLKDTRMLGCKSANTTIESNYKIGLKNDCASVDKGRYQRLVGKLIYLSHNRPDIGFLVS